MKTLKYKIMIQLFKSIAARLRRKPLLAKPAVMARNSFKKGDKVLFKKTEHSYYQTWHKREGFDYYLIQKVMKHGQRKDKIGYRIILPDGRYMVNASASQLLHYAP